MLVLKDNMSQGSKFNKIEKYIQDCAKAVDLELANILNFPSDFGAGTLDEAMRYATLLGGKRLRPFLLIATCDILGVARETSIKFGCVVELIHAYSLVHDDLPAMDNDDVRRGKPSCHKKFSESTAILTGDALLAKAFEIASDPMHGLAPSVQVNIIHKLSKAAGRDGLVGGQFMDMDLKADKLDYPTVVRMNAMKTGAMFAICCDIAVLLAQSLSMKVVHHIHMYSKSIGSAFQILDDILDFEQDSNNGKAASNIVSIVGLDQAKEELKMLTNQAVEMMQIFEEKKASVLVEFAKYINGKAE